MNITHSEMVAKLAKNGGEINLSLDAHKCHVIHMAIGICGEVGELFDGVNNRPEDNMNILEELGDIEFYYEGLDSSIETISDFGAPVLDCPFSEAVSNIVIHSSNILDLCKKYVIYDDKDGLNIQSVRQSMSDLQSNLERIRQEYELSREDCKDANIRKLSKRYENFNYSDDAAKERADKNG